MSEKAATTTAPPASKAKKVKKPSSHPPYIEMIKDAITKSGQRKGISRQAIVKYIGANYKVSINDNVILQQIKLAIKRGVVANVLKQLKGTGASGSFKVNSEKKSAAPKKPAAKAAKPKKAKTTPKKTVKKSPKKVAKKTSVKKITKKSPKKAKSPKVKKPAVKKAAKPKKVTKKAAPKKK
ncbi:histone H1-delta-like [Argonauta hians]